MRSIFGRDGPQQPILAPLGTSGRFSRLSRTLAGSLPPAAAPIAVMLVGGIGVVALLGALLGQDGAKTPPTPAPLVAEETRDADPAPRATAASVDADTPVEAAAARATPSSSQPDAIARTASDLTPAAAEPTALLEPDPARTASILPALSGHAAFMPSVPVAETEEEVAALERIQRREVEDDVGSPSLEETASVSPTATQDMRPAIATRYVNMRAGPDDDAEVLMVVPALAEIEAEADCNWCAVAYDGRTGYVYKTFISYAD